jgi:hypothetical protein
MTRHVSRAPSPDVRQLAPVPPPKPKPHPPASQYAQVIKLAREVRDIVRDTGGPQQP